VDDPDGDRAWTGDQALYASASAKAADVPAPAASSSDKYGEAAAIVGAVTENCFTNGVLHEKSENGWDLDYATGKVCSSGM
jgi:hypothetical protein